MNKETRLSHAEFESKMNAIVIQLSQDLWKDLENILEDNIPPATHTAKESDRLGMVSWSDKELV